MEATLASAAERPDLVERAAALSEVVWPEYNRHGDVLGRYWSRLYDEHPDLQLILAKGDEVIGEAHSLPFAWDGSEADLPEGIDDLLVRAFDGGEEPTALAAVGVEILPGRQGGGRSRLLLEALRGRAAAHGLAHVAVPLRPSWKERYPITPIEEYVRWTRTDGLPFDPWLRVHVRLGAEIVRPAPRSMLITGTVAEWEAWTGLDYPASGEYVFPRGLAPLSVDRDADRATYWEPNVWVRHR
jgi:GNAT superfamily N-acetyltransferase